MNSKQQLYYDQLDILLGIILTPIDGSIRGIKKDDWIQLLEQQETAFAFSH